MTQLSFHFSDPNLDDKEKLRELTTFVKGCANLLQNNARKLDTYTQFIEDELENNPRGLDFLRQANLMVQNINGLASILDPQDDVRKEGEPLNMLPLLRGVINRCTTVFKPQNANVDLDCPQDLTAYGDTLQLQQLVFSILQSLINLQPKNPVVQVTAEDRKYSQDELKRLGSKCQAGTYVEIVIAFSHDKPEKFSCLTSVLDCADALPFNAISSIMWLGVIKRHGGDLLVSSQCKVPALKILLAQSYANQTGTTRTAADLPAPKGTETILLVDDEDMIWDLVIDTLTNLGYTVLLAGDGQEAIDTYRANPGAVDLVIMDMVMPGVNGREAFEQLKRIDPNVKVLLSSGYVSDEDANFVLKAGALGFLRKPYSMKKLGQTVREILDHK